jgi:putative ABC transport system permease protein
MFRHAVLSIWNRRRAEGLVVVEIALAFVAVFAVVAVAVSYWASYRQPLGFEYDRTWAVYLRTGSDLNANSGWTVDQAYTLRNVLQALRSLPRVEAAHVIRVTPFTPAISMSPYFYDGQKLAAVPVNSVSSGALEALGARLAAGRWFNAADEGQPHRVAVANEAYVRKAFAPGVSPLNRNINQLIEHPRPGMDRLPPFFRREVRIVGVVPHFRMSDLAEEGPMVITQYEIEHAVENSVEHPNALFLKVAEGTPADFEKEIVERIRSVAPDWRPVVRQWLENRAQTHSRVLMPVIIGAMLVAFVLVMVVLGLVGVVWQGVVRRTQEIGLRRAVGATARQVRLQIAIETLVSAVAGVAIGTLLAVQLPLLALVEQIDWASAMPGLLLSAALILILVSISALYPGWIASRREPADALRYE